MDPTPAPLQPVAPPSSGGPHTLAASLVALVTALGGVVAAWQGYQGGQDTQRAAYEALKRSHEQRGAQIEELTRGQLELRAWVSELSERLEQRAVATEKAIRKVAPKPKVAALPLPPPAPPPPAPPPPEVKAPEPLPTFEALKR